MEKPLNSPASFRPISLASCVSKLFECITLCRLLFFLESNFILSPSQPGFRPGWSTLDQILYLSQSISDGFNKPMPEYLTIVSTIDLSKAFDSVWHPALFHKVNLAIWSFGHSLTIWPFGPLLPRSPLLWRLHKELCFNWNVGLSAGVFFSIQANVRPPFSQWISTKLTSSPIFSYPLLSPFQSDSNLSWGHLRPHSFLF